MRSRFVYLSVLLLGIVRASSAGIWHVATNGNDGADGTSWETAKQTIQAAIDIAESNDTVLVSNGVYAAGGRVVHDSFTNRVVIDKPITLASVNGPANTTIQGSTLVRCAYVGTNATLSGFTLTGADLFFLIEFGDIIEGDGATWCEQTAIVSNCTITGNWAAAGGGALQGTLINCTLTNNGARYGGGACDSTLINCTLTGNRAAAGGGACGSTLINCTLTNNISQEEGGGAFDCTLIHCTLKGNSSYHTYWPYGGGGAYASMLYNCTLADNTAASRGGGADQSTLNNCILFGNTATNGPNYYDCEIFFSCTTPDPGGMGNITNDPQFVDAAAGNYRLSTNSPCIDRGANFYVQGATDLDGNPRIMNGGVDMGAYECQEALAPRFGYWAWAAGITNGLTNYADCAAGDSYPNLLKYAMGGSATNTDELARLADGISNGLFQVRFNRNTNAQDVILVVECSSAITNGASWQGIATNFLGSWGGAPNVDETGDGSPVAAAVGEIEPASNRIFRLRVRRP